MRKTGHCLAGVLLAHALSGCGAVLPVMDYKHRTDQEFSEFVSAIAAHVKCELHRAVATEYDPDNQNRKVLYDWAAKIALTIRAYDKGNLNPSVSWTNGTQILETAVGFQGETNGTREMTMTYYLPFKEVLAGKQIDIHGRSLDCSRISNEIEPIAGNLGIESSMKAALESWDSFGTLSDRIEGGPFETITHKVSFQVTGGANATPTWTFTDVTVNPSAPFLSATRTRTDELLITMGPTTLGSRKELPAPSDALNQSFQIERLRDVINSR
ncbi:hypothetical protein HFN97_20595 [Rhizobium laguerreae]|uniref:hypothetical protein n=1 Tax=Rhizobium TaxID=379 RepID=UPI001C9265F3|nr:MULTISPECIES: hypothetical protein [Rhizobium]MBY2941842.1 hypothetical protein [Rhizobium leguminosarum]MBY3360197.1 hypothetical protein [Rhizobium laguerreae]